MDRLDCIDNLDRKILSIVMHNARIPSKDVALVCGVSRAAVHQRIQRMIEDGIITGSGYTVNPKTLGYFTCLFCSSKADDDQIYAFCKLMMETLDSYVETNDATRQISPETVATQFIPFNPGAERYYREAGLLK